jgi:hypothetical protein
LAHHKLKACGILGRSYAEPKLRPEGTTNLSL